MTDGGGVPARRAIARWALRLLRREWRQQALVVALLLAAVSASTLAVAIASNAPRSPGAEYGTATKRIQLEADAAALRREEAAARSYFGTIEIIRRWQQVAAGTTTRYEIRGQDPAGAFASSTLSLRAGRLPQSDAEVALTDGISKLTDIRLGSLLRIGDRDHKVVGLVENPLDLDDDFALVAPSARLPDPTTTILFSADDERAHAFPSPVPGMFIDSRGSGSARTDAILGVFFAGVLAMMFVSLTAAAGFAVVAQRRLRQLGMLAAIGASRHHLRLVMLTNGLAVGLLAGLVGVVLGVIAWLVARPLVEPVVGHRIDAAHLPWVTLAACAFLAVASAVAASWWPARAVARLPVVVALASRPAPIKARHRSLLLAVAILTLGVACLAVGIHPEKAQEINPLFFFPGVILTAIAIPLMSPTVVELFGRRTERVPVAVRLALRDLARYQARSAAALGTITLGIALAVAIVVAAAAAQSPPDKGNLSSHQLLIQIGGVDLTNDYSYVPARTPSDIRELETVVERIADALDQPLVVPLDKAVDPSKDLVRDQQTLHSAGLLFKPLGRNGQDGVDYLDQLYVATPQLLHHLNLDPSIAGDGMQVITPHVGQLLLASKAGAVPVNNVERISAPAFTQAPRSLITQRFANANGLTQVRAGWLLESRSTVTDSQLETARAIAADADITIQARDRQKSLARIKLAALLAGALLSISVISLTIGLIRSEAANDLRILTATGASTTTRRAITAIATTALALAGAALGAAFAYIALIASYWPAADLLTNVPYAELSIFIVAIPLAVGAAAWLLAGKEHADLGRGAIT